MDLACYARAVRVVATVLPGCAISLTAARLGYRWRRRHLGWDDAWVTSALCSAIIMCAGAWTATDVPGVGPFDQSVPVRVVGSYMSSVAFICVMWSARISILCSILRILPYFYYYRPWAQRATYLFGVLWASLLISKFYICESNSAWKQGLRIQCPMNRGYAIVEGVFDCTADIILVTLPLRLICRLTTGITHYRQMLLIVMFSSNLLTSLASIVHCTFMYRHHPVSTAISGYVSASVAVFVCNFGIIATWIYNCVQGQDSELQVHGAVSASSSPDGWNTNGYVGTAQFRVSESTTEWAHTSTSNHHSAPGSHENIQDTPGERPSQCDSNSREDSSSIVQKPSVNSLSSTVTAVSRNGDPLMHAKKTIQMDSEDS